MTRTEFIDEITTLEELISFCEDLDIDICSDIYTDCAKDEFIDEHLYDICQNACWRDVLDTLANIPTGYEFYTRVEAYWLEFVGIPDARAEFFRRKACVLELCDQLDDLWECEDDVFNDTEDTQYEFEADSSVSLPDFFESNAAELEKITAESKLLKDAENTEFNKFIATTIGCTEGR